MRKVSRFEVVSLGADNPDYFQGFGVSGSQYDEAFTGMGADAHDALEDALEMASFSGWDVTGIDAKAALVRHDVPDSMVVLTTTVWLATGETSSEYSVVKKVDGVAGTSSEHDEEDGVVTVHNCYDAEELINDIEQAIGGPLGRDAERKIRASHNNIADFYMYIGLRLK